MRIIPNSKLLAGMSGHEPVLVACCKGIMAKLLNVV